MTVGDDKTIKVWGAEEGSWSDLPRDTVVSKNMVTGLSISASGDTFATCGEATQLWTRGRHVPSRTFQWGVDTIHHVRFNPVETHLLGATSADRYLRDAFKKKKKKCNKCYIGSAPPPLPPP